MFHEHERFLVTLFLIGAVAAMGRALIGAEPITLRLFFGRTLAGAALSMSAAALLIRFPDMSPLAVAGAGAALGVAGYQCVEIYLRYLAKKHGVGKSQ